MMQLVSPIFSFSIIIVLLLAVASAADEKSNDENGACFKLNKIGDDVGSQTPNDRSSSATFFRFSRDGDDVSQQTEKTINSSIASERAGDAVAEVVVHTCKCQQKLDHNDISNKNTWLQRYLINKGYESNNADRPKKVFLMISGENAVDFNLMIHGFWDELAEKYHALCLQLEHRYYGESIPTDVSTENLRKYLKVSLALADIAYFIKAIKTVDKYKLSKWIVFGGSYAGALAAWMRSRYPNLVEGSVASSAAFPLRLEFPELYESVSRTLQSTSHGTKCTDEIKKAMDDLSTRIKSKNREQCGKIKTMFKLKPTLDCDDEFHVFYLFFKIFDNIFAESIVNLNRPKQLSINRMCDIMTDDTVMKEPICRLASLVGEKLILAVQSNLNVDYEGYIEIRTQMDLKDTAAIELRSWNFQICTEMGNIPTSRSIKQLFGHYIDIDLMLRLQCTEVFGNEFRKLFVSNEIIKSADEKGKWQLDFGHTIFPVGDLDPWKGTGITKEKAGDSVILIQGASHCEDMHQRSSTDSQSMKNAKNEIEEKIEEWIRGN